MAEGILTSVKGAAQCVFLLLLRFHRLILPLYGILLPSSSFLAVIYHCLATSEADKLLWPLKLVLPSYLRFAAMNANSVGLLFVAQISARLIPGFSSFL